MDDFDLAHCLIKVGTRDFSLEYWNWKLIESDNFRLLGEAAEEIARKIGDGPERPHCFCALKQSGVALAALLSYLLEIDFLRFERTSAQYLFPPHVVQKLRDKRVAMVDTHIICGRALLRHGIILENLGAQICQPIVLVDCDNVPRDEEYINFARRYRFEAPYSFVRVKEYVGLLLSSGNPKLIQQGQLISDKGERYWREQPI